MSFNEWVQILPIAMSTITLAVMIGMWRSRQEAADKAAEQAIATAGTVYGLRIENLETKLEAQAQLVNERLRSVDRDVSGVRESIADVKARLASSDVERREEFQRLHTKANETHALIVKHLTELQRVFVPREEYNSRHTELQRRVERLEETGEEQ